MTGAEPAVTLRRADWRFLLPLPPPGAFAQAVVLGASPALADRLLAAGFARAISRSIPAEGSSDAVIVLHDAVGDLDRAAAAVAPHGVLYVEVDRRRAGRLLWTPARMSRRLAALGLRTVGQYWVVPGFRDARRFIPLQRGRAVAWYLETIYRQFSKVRLAIGTLARAWIGGDSSRLAPLVPAYSIVAVGRSAASGVPSLLTDIGCAGAVPADAPVALVTGGHDDGSRVVLLPFSGGNRPCAVVKIARIPAFNNHTLFEQATLREIHSRLPSALQPMVPMPYGSRLWRGLAVSVESFADGRTLLASTGRQGAAAADQIDDLRAATDWLIRFHDNARARIPGWRPPDLDRWLAALFDHYTRTCGTSQGVARLFARARQSVSGLGEVPLPIVLQHNDFGPWNVHRSAGGLVVVDWESVEGPERREGPALMDLVYFVTHWFFVATHAHDQRSRHRAFAQLLCDRASVRGLAVHHALAAYMSAFHIAPAFLSVAQVATWVRRAVEREMRRHGTGAPNHDRDLVAVLAAHADELFPCRT